MSLSSIFSNRSDWNAVRLSPLSSALSSVAWTAIGEMSVATVFEVQLAAM